MAKKIRKPNIGDELIESMQEALAFMRGEKVKVRVTKVDTPAIEIKRIRKKVGLTQDSFASALGVSVSGLRKWEQGQRQPRGAALTLLRVMDKEPEAVVRVIRSR
jgi:putative transcriptional regulator